MADASNTVGLAFLQNAAQTACNGSTGKYAVFCKSGASQIANGIFLQIPWCNWEPDSTSTSCLYIVDPLGNDSGQPNGPMVQQNITSACTSSTFDNCVPAGTTSLKKCLLTTPATLPTATYGVLFQALFYICQIDAQRALAGLGPLVVSVGLEAGLRTPVHVQNTSGGTGGPGIIDMPFTTVKSDGSTAGFVCGRLPLVWTGNYASAYNTAFTTLINYIGGVDNYVAGGQLTAAGPVLVAAKIDGINTDTAELVLSGTASIPLDPNTSQPYSWVTDPGSAHINCGVYLNAGTPPAQHWLDTFGQTSHTALTFAQFVENGFGSLTGYEYGAMKAASALTPNSVSANFLLSIEIQNSASFPDVNCGTANSGQIIPGTGPGTGPVGPGKDNTCIVDSPYLTGNSWTNFYLAEAILKLTSNDVPSSSHSARAAYANFATEFTFAQLSLNTTNLQLYPSMFWVPGPVSGNPGQPPSATPTMWLQYTNCLTTYTQCNKIAINQLPCNINNNVDSLNRGTMQIGNDNGTDTNYTIIGVGTVLGSQTAFADVKKCGSTDYDTIMSIATTNGSRYLEISPTEATTPACQSSYVTILPTLLSPTQAHCLYGSQQ